MLVGGRGERGGGREIRGGGGGRVGERERERERERDSERRGAVLFMPFCLKRSITALATF